MRVISKATLVESWRKHPASKQALQTWFEDANHSQWKTPQDITLRYASASFMGANRGGVQYQGQRLSPVVAAAYRFAALYIKFIGTHAQYDAIDAATVENQS
jgi:mRNA interferase HigB